MDTLQSKLNVIEWLTDFKGHVFNREHDRLIELRHKKGYLTCMYTGKSDESLMEKLNGFLDRKLKVIRSG